MRKKSLVIMLAIIIASVSLLAGCGSNNSKGTDIKESATPSGSVSTGEKSKVSVWYLWGGREGAAIEEVISRFNSSQDKYIVEGLSVPDEQKIKVAISSGNGPDLTDSFSRNVSAYAESGISTPLDDLIARDKYDMSDFVPAALGTVTYKGKVHALPLNVTNDALYYNKKLLAEAGYTEPPKTSKELLEMSIKMTKLNDNGSIKVLGFPMYPVVPYRHLTYAFGGTHLTEDGKEPLFESKASIEALNVIYAYTEKFGEKNVKEIQASGKWLDPTDPFLRGEQAFRIESSPLTAFIESNNLDIDYGVAPLPYLEGQPETAGSVEIKSSTFYITKTAKNVDGAWEFMKYMYSAPELAKVMATMSNIPAKMSAWKDPLFADKVNEKKFMEYSQNQNAKTLPNIPQLDEILNKIIKEEVEALANLKSKPDEAAKKMQDRTISALK